MPAAAPLPIVLVGDGDVSRRLYLPALAQLEKRGLARLVAVVGHDLAASVPDPGVAMFSHARRFARLEAVTTLERGALAILVSPVNERAQQVEFAARSGWHILCENSFATTSAAAEKMLAAAETAKVRLGVAQPRRFCAAARALKHLCTGLSPLGQLMRFTIHEGHSAASSPAPLGDGKRATETGGALRDLGPEVLDLLIWWLGVPLDFVYADDAMGGREINAHLTLRFGAATGQVHLSQDWMNSNRSVFDFARGRAVWTLGEANRLTVELQGMPFALQSELVETDGRRADTHPQSFIKYLEQVIACARDDVPMPVDGTTSAHLLGLIESCYARRRLLPQPWLTSEERWTAQNLAEAPR